MDTSVEQVGAEIDREVEGRTLLDLFDRNASQFGERPALNWKDGETWRQVTWREYVDAAQEVAVGLRELGLGDGEFVALQAANRPEHVIADAGALYAAATPVSLYNTLAPDQIAYVAGNCEAKIAILENRDYFKRWDEVRGELDNLTHVVLMEDAEDFGHYDWVLSWDDLRAKGRQALAAGSEALETARRAIAPEDPATLVYTSGTTGPPKGVVITHRNVLWELHSVDRVIALPPGMRGLSYLPLAHIAERAFSHYIGLHKAGEVYFCPDIGQAVEVATHARPEAFVAVPRVWEKIQAALRAGVEDEENERRRKLILKALEVGEECARAEQAGASPPLAKRIQRALFDRLVYGKIRARIGLDQCQLALSGAAPIATDVLYFFAGIGLPIHEVYGMTETTAVTHANRPGAIRIGSVGQPLPGVEHRLDEDGELLARGGNITAGYYRRPEETAATYLDDGWLRTGDLGEIDGEDYLRIVGRKKEILITAGGKNIAPTNIEGLLKQHPLIGQATAIGDGRPFVSALIVLDGDAAPAWAERHGITFSDIASFIEDERVQAEVARAVEQANEQLARVEQVRKYRVLPTEWTAESEELTPTLKLRRSVIHDKYADEIEALYRSEPAAGATG